MIRRLLPSVAVLAVLLVPGRASAQQQGPGGSPDSVIAVGTRRVAPKTIAPSMIIRLVDVQPAVLMIPVSTIAKIPITARPRPRTKP